MYGACDSDLNVIRVNINSDVIRRFLDGCHKCHFTSQPVSIFNLLEQQDESAFSRAIKTHMLGSITPKEKETGYYLHRRKCHLSQIKTERYNKTFQFCK